jgi:hypothetical protein
LQHVRGDFAERAISKSCKRWAGISRP